MFKLSVHYKVNVYLKMQLLRIEDKVYHNCGHWSCLVKCTLVWSATFLLVRAAISLAKLL